MITSYKDYQTGVYQLPFSSISAKNLTSYIAEFEPEYLSDLLGCELADLLNADLDENTPQSERFIKIFEPFCETIRCEYTKSLGMKIMLKGFMYFKYGNSLTNDLTSVGAKNNDSENASTVKASATRLISNYNRSIQTYKSIQDYICENADTYPEFKGVEKEFISFL